MSTVITDPITNVSEGDFQTVVLFIATAIYGALVVCGVLFVTVFALVLFKGHSTFKEIPFFTIVWQLTICNFLGIYIQAFCKFPLLFINTSDESSWQSIWELTGTHIIYFTDTGFTLFVLLMALNRFAVFVQPKMMVLFSKRIIWYPIVITWLLVCIITTIKVVWGGQEKFDRKNWSITQLLVKTDADILVTIVSWLDYVASVLMLLIYLSIYIMIRKKRSVHGLDDQNDTSLLTQAVVVALSLVVFRMLANLSGAVRAENYVAVILNILRFSASVCNNMLNPILFLTTKNIRSILKEMFHCGHRASREETNSSEQSASPSKHCCLPFYKVNPGGQVFTTQVTLVSKTENNAVSPIS